MKKTSKRLSVLAAVLVFCFVAAMPAFAVDTPYTAVSGTSTTFQKALIMDANANVPTVTFSYSIEPGTAVAASSGKMEVISPSAATGVTGTPSIADISYAPGDATVTTAAGVTLESGEKAALKTVTVDFSGVSFSEPGVYRYLVTETSADQQGVSYDTQSSGGTGFTTKQRVLDVYVLDNNGALTVDAYILHELVGDISTTAELGSVGGALADKSLGYVNEYETFDLTLSKTVAGNQGSHDKYFKFTVAITNAGANVALDVDWTSAVDALNAVKSSATVYAQADMQAANQADDNATISGNQWITDANGAVTKIVYLKHGQSITVKGLASGAKYTITEVPEDYKCSATDNKIEDTTGMAADATCAFTNTRNGVVPTGVVLSVMGGIALAAIGIGGIGYAVVAEKKSKDEDEI